MSLFLFFVIVISSFPRRAQFMKGADADGGVSGSGGGTAGGGGGGGGGGNTYSRSLAEIQNHHNDSQEQLSPPPGPRSKHDEAYSGNALVFAPTDFTYWFYYCHFLWCLLLLIGNSR